MISSALPELPVQDGSITFDNLNSFWTNFYEDKQIIRDYCEGSGLEAAQVYLNFVEAVNALSRNDIPVFHRERWYPILIRKSERNTGSPIISGQQPPLFVGPQPEGTEYEQYRVYELGDSAFPSGISAYKINSSAPVKAGIQTISDTIIRPTTTLATGVHFSLDNTFIIFREDSDPFDLGTFPTRLVDNNGTTDQEILLWATDVLFDYEFLYDNYGYAIRLQDESSEYYKDVINALWNIRFSTANLASLRASIGDMLGNPAVKSDGETIEVIHPESDESISVVTDSNVYSYPPNTVLLPTTVVGAVVNQGDFLTETVRLYTKLDPDKFYGANGIPLSDFVLHVPSLYIPKGIIGSYGGESGLVADWKTTDITFEGNDANGNPKYQFDLGGAPTDVQAYWENLWGNAETQGVDLYTDVFEPYIYSPPPYIALGIPVGTINPLDFFMRTFLKPNVGIIVVDFSALPSNINSLAILSRLNNLIAAHALLIIIGKQSVSDQDYSLGTMLVESLDAPYGKAVSDTFSTAGDGGVTYRWVKVT